MSFREAYQQVGGEVQAGTYKPDLGKQHSHAGSIGNLCLDKIKEKLGSMKKFLSLLSIILFVVSCSKEEMVQNELKRITFKSFEIINNSDEGISIKAELDKIEEKKISSYGVKWFSVENNSVIFEEIFESDLLSNNFDFLINKNIKKDYRYNVFSFVESEDIIYNSDTIEVVSQYYSPALIDNVYPTNGFINDTINITGKNFCDTSSSYGNYLYLNGSRYNSIYKSDSLIRAVIPKFISESELEVGIETCGMYNGTDFFFTINPPVLDSIQSGDKYIGEKLKLYGKNIHYFISELWLDGKRAELDFTNYKDTIIATVPRDLSEGKVNLELKVLDRVIKKENYFQTTTPFITYLEPESFGFLDTIKVKGKYFKQAPNINVGNVKQNVISFNDQEIVFVVDKYFSSSTPIMEVEIGDFTPNETVSFLPPKLTGFDKEAYDLTDEIIISTDNFISKYNIEIGEEGIASNGVGFNINPDGEITTSLKNWLKVEYNYPSYIIEDTGKLKIELDNSFGSDSDYIKLNPPLIESINKEVFIYNDIMIIYGKNFSYSKFCDIYIDGQHVNTLDSYRNNDVYNIDNDKIGFKLKTNTTSGKHNLHIEVAGQKSNVIEYIVGEVKVNSINEESGTRRDEYTLTGENIEGLKLYADNKLCEILEESSSEIVFKLPYSKPLEALTEITGVLGDQVFNVVDFLGIESHSSNEETLNDVSYYGKHVSGSDSENWYYINNNGVFKFNLNTIKWEVFDTAEVPFNTPLFGEKLHLTVTNEYLYLPYGNTLYSYELSSKIWKANSIEMSVKRGVFVDDNLYAVSNSDNEFYVGNVNENTYSKVSTSFSFNYETMAYGGEKVFFNSWKGEVFYYDINSQNFKGIGRPRNYYGSYQNVSLKYYNNKLYFSGGLTNTDEEHRLYEYNFDTDIWVEKTPLLHKMYNHHIFIRDGVFYSGLGNGENGYKNKEMDIYKLNIDPH